MAELVAESERSSLRSLANEYTSLPLTVHILCLGSLLNRAGSFVMVFLSIYVAEQLQLGTQFATRCVGMVGLGSVASSLIGGQFADQIGRRKTMLIALLGGSAMLIVMSQMTTALGFLLSVLLFALIMEMYRPACAAMIGDVSTPRQRPYSFGLMYIAINLGFAIAPPLGGFLAAVDFRWLFWGDALTTAGFGIVVLLFVRETRPGRRRVSPPDVLQDPIAEGSPAAAARGHVQESEQDKTTPLWTAVRHIAADRTFLLYCTCNLLTCIVFMQSFSTLPLHLIDRGYSEFEYGALICINGAMIVVLQLPITHLLNRFNRVTTILAGECLLAAGFGLTTFASSTGMIVFTIVLWTCGEIIQAPFKQSIVADLAPPAMRARYMGVFTVSYALALMIGAPLGGEVLVRLGAHWLWPGCFLIMVTAIMLYLAIYRNLSAACESRAGLHTVHARGAEESTHSPAGPDNACEPLSPSRSVNMQRTARGAVSP